VDETLGYLADVGVNLANAFNPEVLVLAGGLARALPGADRVLEAAIRSRALPPASRTRVEFAAFGEDAVALGAAALALDRAVGPITPASSARNPTSRRISPRAAPGRRPRG
jgi:glucokinase